MVASTISNATTLPRDSPPARVAAAGAARLLGLLLAGRLLDLALRPAPCSHPGPGTTVNPAWHEKLKHWPPWLRTRSRRGSMERAAADRSKTIAGWWIGGGFLFLWPRAPVRGPFFGMCTRMAAAGGGRGCPRGRHGHRRLQGQRVPVMDWRREPGLQRAVADRAAVLVRAVGGAASRSSGVAASRYHGDGGLTSFGATPVKEISQDLGMTCSSGGGRLARARVIRKRGGWAGGGRGGVRAVTEQQDPTEIRSASRCRPSISAAMRPCARAGMSRVEERPAPARRRPPPGGGSRPRPCGGWPGHQLLGADRLGVRGHHLAHGRPRGVQAGDDDAHQEVALGEDAEQALVLSTRTLPQQFSAMYLTAPNTVSSGRTPTRSGPKRWRWRMERT